LTTNYPENEEILKIFASVLVNLSHLQNIKGATLKVNMLKDLVENRLDSEEIAVEYAKGLFNLINWEDLKCINKVICRLEKLLGQWPGNEEINLMYAQCLVNLAVLENIEDAKKIMSIWKSWQKNNRKDGIVVHLLVGCTTLSMIKTQETRQKH
jgi:hypothetical protein